MKKLIAVLAILAMAGAANAAIEAEFVKTQTNVASFGAGNIDVWELKINSDNPLNIDTLGQDATNGLKLVGTNFLNNALLGKTWSNIPALTNIGSLVEDSFIVSPDQAPPAVVVGAVDTANELSVTAYGVVGGAAIPALASEYTLALISVPTGTPDLGAANWAQDVVAISGGNAVDTIIYVPEPATMALLGLGGLAVLRRRRA